MSKTKKKKGPAPGTLYKNVTRTESGKKLAALRRSRGLTQSELAKRTGLTQRVISYYERESETIPSQHLRKIAHALNVTTDKILGYETEPTNLEINRAFLRRLEIAKTLPPKKQKIINDLIDSFIEDKDESK